MGWITKSARLPTNEAVTIDRVASAGPRPSNETATLVTGIVKTGRCHARSHHKGTVVVNGKVATYESYHEVKIS